MAAMAYQHGMSDSDHGKDYAIELFRHATQEGISADGRMINALFRCFRDDLGAALEFWKMDVRPACLSHIKRVVKRNGNSDQLRQQNLLAAYSGLLYVCGCARRPDIALRIVYAMNKEGIEPMEISYNNYKTGKRARQEPELKGPIWNPTGASKKRGFSTLLSKLSMMKQYESLLYVECTKYNAYDRRTEKDKRLRIIV
jgi:pentatricopeptide repeat protein